MFLGWAPTAIGYTAQGICKFGFYEFFKNVYSGAIGEENTFLYRTSLYLAASASAEFFADIALSPMESCKVRRNMLASLQMLLCCRSGFRPRRSVLSPQLCVGLSLRSGRRKECLASTSHCRRCGAVRSLTP